jgi:hypothetical protein
MLVVSAGFWLAGCALMTHGTRQTVSVATDPPGAVVTVSGHRVANPSEVSLLRNREYQVVAQWPDGQTASAQIYSDFSWVTALNWVPIVGPTVDFVSGAAYELNPDVVALMPEPYASPALTIAKPDTPY